MDKLIVTTSWDDGHVLDLKLAKLLSKYNLKGTFYVAPKNQEIKLEDRLGNEQIKELSQDFEIGAHTMTHPKLTSISDSKAYQEILDSKEYLEKVLNKKVQTFCYPSGDFSAKHAEMVRKIGFKLARTVRRFSNNTGTKPFMIPTTVHAYRHWSDALPILKHAGMAKFFNQYLDWDQLAISIFDRLLVKGGVFHLWGHSWEIENNNDWEKLERVFKHISNRTSVQYLTNEELI